MGNVVTRASYVKCNGGGTCVAISQTACNRMGVNDAEYNAKVQAEYSAKS